MNAKPHILKLAQPFKSEKVFKAPCGVMLADPVAVFIQDYSFIDSPVQLSRFCTKCANKLQPSKPGKKVYIVGIVSGEIAKEKGLIWSEDQAGA